MSRRIEKIETSRLILRQWCETDILLFAEMNIDLKVMKYFSSTASAQESESLARRFKNMLKITALGHGQQKLKRPVNI